MIPQLFDGEGHDIDRLSTFDRRQWLFEMECLLELAEAHAEGRKVSFKIPSAVHEQGAST